MERDENAETFGILIVEDEHLVALSLCLLISQAPGYRVTGSAATMEQAVALSERDPPDLALLDLRLANGQSGLDVAGYLRLRDISCLFLTGNPPPAPRPDLAIGCLPKPFHDDSLMAALDIARGMVRGNGSAGPLPPGLQLY